MEHLTAEAVGQFTSPPGSPEQRRRVDLPVREAGANRQDSCGYLGQKAATALLNHQFATVGSGRNQVIAILAVAVPASSRSAEASRAARISIHVP